MLAAQSGVCAICLRPPKSRRLDVDHDHKTGRIRGILCTMCNHKLLGVFHDNAVLFARAAAYLGYTQVVPLLELNDTPQKVEGTDAIHQK